MSKKGKLLIVDDELSNLQKLQRTFLSDFQIISARSGEDAIRVLENQQVDVVITDQRMPGMAGVELLKKAQETCPDALRIILTGYTEVEYLMEAINTGQAHRYITKPWEPFALRQTVLQDLELARLRRENGILEEQLRIAREVQGKLLPQSFPLIGNLDYSGVCRQAGQVGGDYFDFLKISDHELCIAVGDISGKGISAALLMASLQALLRSQLPAHRDSLSQMVTEMNRVLHSLTDDSKFASFFCGIADTEKRQFRYVNAGHNPPLLVSKAADPHGNGCRPLYLEANGVVLGMFRKVEYLEAVVDFAPGDLLCVYTDGLLEARNSSGEHFTESRLESLLCQNRHLPAFDIQELVVQDTERFASEVPLGDDLTIVVVKAA